MNEGYPASRRELKLMGRDEFVDYLVKVMDKELREKLPVAGLEWELMEKSKWIMDDKMAHVMGCRVVA